jgi:hypothetical protein
MVWRSEWLILLMSLARRFGSMLKKLFIPREVMEVVEELKVVVIWRLEVVAFRWELLKVMEVALR